MHRHEKGAVFIETAMIVGFLLGLCFLLLVTGTHIVRYLQVTSISQQGIRLANSLGNLPIACFSADPDPFTPVIDRITGLFAGYRTYTDNISAPFYLRTAPTTMDVCHEFISGTSGPTQVIVTVTVPIELLFGNSGFQIGGVSIRTTGPYLYEET